MDLFFDTSAVVPLILDEPHSRKALETWNQATRVWAWRWLQVEAEAALGRRRADAHAWHQWRLVSSALTWLDLEARMWPQLCAFNRSLRLRAADAGHLYTYNGATSVVPQLKLVCFDKELNEAARALGLDLIDQDS
jgi:predicted nucleic acid-binding protein